MAGYLIQVATCQLHNYIIFFNWLMLLNAPSMDFANNVKDLTERRIWQQLLGLLSDVLGWVMLLWKSHAWNPNATVDKMQIKKALFLQPVNSWKLTQENI